MIWQNVFLLKHTIMKYKMRHYRKDLLRMQCCKNIFWLYARGSVSKLLGYCSFSVKIKHAVNHSVFQPAPPANPAALGWQLASAHQQEPSLLKTTLPIFPTVYSFYYKCSLKAWPEVSDSHQGNHSHCFFQHLLSTDWQFPPSLMGKKRENYVKWEAGISFVCKKNLIP